MPQAMWAAACVTSLLAHPDVTLAVDPLVSQKQQLRRRAQGIQEILQGVYSSTSEERRFRMTAEPATKEDKAALARARAFLSECRLRDWVEEQNVQKGIAPMSGVALQHLRGQTLRRDLLRKHDLQWLRRWRKRWKVTLGTFPGRENVDAKEAQRKATYVYVCMTRGRDYSSVQNVASIWASMGGRGSAFGGSRGSNSEGPYGHQKPPQKWTPGRPKSGPPAAHGGQNGGHILDAKMVPLIHFIKAGGPQKRPLKISVFLQIFRNWGSPSAIPGGARRLAVEQLLALADAAQSQASANQHGRDSDSLVARGAAWIGICCG